MIKTVLLSTLLGLPLTYAAYQVIPKHTDLSVYEQARARFTAESNQIGFDAGKSTENALQGLSKLLEQLQSTQLPSDQLKALKLNIAVMTSYLAILTSNMEPEDRQEVTDLAKMLFDTVHDKGKPDKDHT